MISVIIPLYNKAKYIQETLLSVLGQTLADFEVIVVNDGSTDDSAAQVTPLLSDERIRLIHQKNQGVSAARNNGITHARYDLIAFMDADDLWHPQYLQIQLEVLNNRPDVSISTAAYIRVSEDFSRAEFPEYRSVNPEVVEDYFADAHREIIFCTITTVVRKSVFEKLAPFNTSIASGEDIDMWFRIMTSYKGIKIPLTLAFYRTTEGDLNNKYKLPAIEKHLIYQMLDLYEPYRKLNIKFFDHFLFNFILIYISHYYFMGDAHHKANSIVNRIPLKYKLRKPRFWLYLLPFFAAKPIYKAIMVLRERNR